MSDRNPTLPSIPALDFAVERIAVDAKVRQWEIKPDPVEVLIQRVDKLLSLLEADNSVILTGKSAIDAYKKLTGE